MFYTPPMRAEYREEPCTVRAQPRQGDAVRVVAQPVHGLRPPVHVLLRPRLRATRRPAADDALRHVDPRQGQRRRRAAARARAAVVARESVAIGAATDPYQPAEGRYRLTRACIEALAAAANPFSIITRGPLIVRDVDVLAEAARRAEVSVTFSVPTLDTRSGGGPSPARRRRASGCARSRMLVDAGVRASVGMAPILPGHLRPRRSSSRRSSAPRARPAPAGSGRTCSTCRPGTREHFLACLARDWPELLPEYERLYAARALPAQRARPSRCARRARARPRHGIRDRRRDRLAPPPPPSS